MTLLRWLTFLSYSDTCPSGFIYSFGASICPTMVYSLLGNFNYAVASVFIHFPSNTKCKIALHMTILVLIGMDFVIIWEIPLEDIFRLRIFIQKYAWS